MKDPVKALLMYSGKNMSQLAALMGTSVSTAYRRTEDPEKITIADIRLLSKLVNRPESAVFAFVSKGEL